MVSPVRRALIGRCSESFAVKPSTSIRRRLSAIASPTSSEGLRRHNDRGFTASTTGELLAAAAVPRTRGAT
jgi:hypothetical protein